MITQADRLLEHPEVAGWRRWLDSKLEAGDVISYSNLRWDSELGVQYVFIPKHPLTFVFIQMSMGHSHHPSQL